MEVETIKEQQTRLLEGLEDFYRQRLLTDVILVAGDVEFPCHRIVLAASSSYFRAMFTSGVRESDQTTIPLHGIHPDALGTILSYVYTGKVEVSVETAQNVLMAANLLNMTHIVDVCANYMASKLTLENCLEIHNFAVYHSYQRLVEKSMDFLLTHISEIREKINNLYSLEYESILQLVSSDELNVAKEEIVFETVIDWIKYNLDERKHYISKLFKEIRLPLIDEDYFRENIEQCSIIRADPFSNSILTSFKIYRLQFDVRDISANFSELSSTTEDFQIKSNPRIGMHNKQLLVFSGGADDRESRSLTAYDPYTKMNYSGIKRHPTFDFKYKIDHYQLITTSNNEIYFLGGIFFEDYHFDEGGSALNDVLMFDWKSISWRKMAPMLNARCCFSACYLKNNIFAIGGKSFYPTGLPFDTMECYDTEIDYWQELAPIPIRIYSHASAVHEDAIFIFGGIEEENDYLDTVLRYKIPTNSWTLVRTEMRRPVAECIAVSYHRKIYVLGGASKHENNLSLDIYDPETNRWSYGNDFPEERKILAVTLLGDRLYVCGGIKHFSSRFRRSKSVETNDLHSYDFKSKVWQKEAKLVQYANMQCCTTSVLNTMYLQESEFISSV